MGITLDIVSIVCGNRRSYSLASTVIRWHASISRIPATPTPVKLWEGGVIKMRADCFSRPSFIHRRNKGTTYIPMVADIQRFPFTIRSFVPEYSVFMNLAELVRLHISGIDREANVSLLSMVTNGLPYRLTVN